MQIAFFDVDGTLLLGFSGYYTTRELIRRRIIKKRRLPLALLYKILASVYTGNVRKMYEVAITDMAGAKAEDISSIAREIFERDLKPLIFREALEEIESHKKKGNEVVLISSGPTMAVKTISDFVGADRSFSIGPVVENNILQARLAEPFVYREGKVHTARAEAERKGLSLKDCYFYSDGHHDIPLLSAVGNPRAVNPDRRLKKEAVRKGWPVMNFKTLLGPS